MTWTRRTLHREIQKLFTAPSTTFRFADLSRTSMVAHVEWGGGSREVAITTDPLTGSTIGNIIHECLHVLCDKTFQRFDMALNEVLILSLEENLWDYISDDPRRLRWWRTALQDKVSSLES